MMLDHAETIARASFAKFPDGRYECKDRLDNDGLSEANVPYEMAVEIRGSEITVDFTRAPPQVPGPINCTLPQTLSLVRVALTMLAGPGELPNEGTFRSVRVLTRPGTLFHAAPPAPSYLGDWTARTCLESLFTALGQALPEAVSAQSGADHCDIVWWGQRAASGEGWYDNTMGAPGHGGTHCADGLNATMQNGVSNCRTTPTEVHEAKRPLFFDVNELFVDSSGPGRFRGGLGQHTIIRILEDSWMTGLAERTQTRPKGLVGGGDGVSPFRYILHPDGRREPLLKVSRQFVRKGTVIDLYTGGGGGFGPATERSIDRIESDVREDYLSAARALADYPQAAHSLYLTDLVNARSAASGQDK
jgi:N-methylhydantoinase B